MAYSSSSSNANSKVHTCSTKCEQSYAQLKKLYDTQREQLGDASIEIQAYTQALKSQLSANDKASFRHNGAKESKVSEIITSVSKVKTSNSETSNDKVEMTKIKTVRISEPNLENGNLTVKNETVKQAENPRKNNKSPRGNKRNWNGMMTQKLDYGEGVVSAARRLDVWIVVLRIGKLQGIGEFSVQTASAKEFSNPLIADSLLETIWFLTHHASQEFKNHLSDNEESLGEDASKQGRIDDADAEVTFIDENFKMM
ncbi:hypothetical protein Tco_1522656 [Tanacetum coccineum]